MRRSILGLACFLIFTPFAAADELDDALAAYKAQRYGEAISLLMPLGEAGNVEAQMALAKMYHCGLGLPADAAAAYAWTQRAAGQGHPAAIYDLGVLTMNGQGVGSDPIGAMRMFVRAAELSDPDALYLLGGMYLQIAPATGDVGIGIDYLARAIALGHQRASALLATVMNELPEIPHQLIKSALELQTATAAGCDDTEGEGARTIAGPRA